MNIILHIKATVRRWPINTLRTAAQLLADELNRRSEEENKRKKWGDFK